MLNFSSFILYGLDWNLKYHSHVWVHLPFQFEQDQYFLSFYFTFSPPSITKRKEKTRSQRYLKYKIFFFFARIDVFAIGWNGIPLFVKSNYFFCLFITLMFLVLCFIVRKKYLTKNWPNLKDSCWNFQTLVFHEGF